MIKHNKNSLVFQPPAQTDTDYLLKKIFLSPLFTALPAGFEKPPTPDIHSDIYYDQIAPKPDCPLGMPQIWVNEPKKIPKRTKRKIYPVEKYPQLAYWMRRGIVNDDELVLAAEKHLSTRFRLLKDNLDGSISSWLSSVKGDDYYANKQNKRLVSAMDKLKALPGSLIFLTLTYSPNECTHNQFYAMQQIDAILNNFLKRLRRFCKLSYICVMEFTAKGFPHYHIVLKFKDMTFESVKDKHGRLLFKNKEMFAMLKSYQPYQQFTAYILPDNAPSSYITKYITKGMQPNVVENYKKTGKLSDSERKSILCYMYGIMGGFRQFRVSKDLGNTQPDALKEEVKKAVNEIEHTIDTPENDINDPNILIPLLNKLTNRCRCSTWAMYNKALSKEYDILDGYQDNPDRGAVIQFKRIGYPLGCQGCIITNMLDTIAGKPILYPPKMSTEEHHDDLRRKEREKQKELEKSFEKYPFLNKRTEKSRTIDYKRLKKGAKEPFMRNLKPEERAAFLARKYPEPKHPQRNYSLENYVVYQGKIMRRSEVNESELSELQKQKTNSYSRLLAELATENEE